MSKKRVGIKIFLILFIMGFFVFGAEIDTNITQTFSEFKNATKTETFKMIKFSTVDYPKVKAYFYLAIDKNNPNFKVVDGTFDPKSSVHIGDTDKKGISIVQLDSDTKGNGLDYYSILIEYDLTGNITTSSTRSAQFYIVNSSGGNKLTTDINNYSVGEIDALFINPNRDTKILSRQNAKIILSGKARAKIKRGTYYADPNGTETTVISSNVSKTKFISSLNSTSSEVSDPIKSGNFIVDSSTTMGGGVGTPYVENGVTWYPVTLEMSNSAVDTNVKAVFANLLSKPNGHSMTFTAISESGLKGSDTLDGVNVAEKDPPLITSITTTNHTLETFMFELFGNIGYGTKTVASSIGLTNENLVNNLLDVKDGDNVDIEFTIDDESITNLKGRLNVIYNGVTYSYVDGEKGINPIEYRSIIGTKTTWKITVPKYIVNSKIVSFNITDKSLSPNNINSDLTLFTEPPELANTNLKPNTNSAGTTTYSNYYKNSSIDINTAGTNDAIAYMIVYDLDKSKSDSGSTEKLSNQLQGVLKTNTKLTFPNDANGNGDGEYKYAEIYTINKAGAIKGITSASVNTYDSINKAIILKGKDTTSYIDTIPPRVSSYDFYKYSDANVGDFKTPESISLYNNLLIGSRKPYKTGDGIEIKATVKEYNMAGTTDTTGIASWNVIPTTGIYDIANGALYEKKGTAIDLTGTTGNDPRIISSIVYDMAGNSTPTTSVSVIFDDRIPSVLTASSMVTGNSIKFTSNTNIPLEIVTGVPLSVAFVDHYLSDNTIAKTYVGNVTGANSSSVNLSSFSGFESVKNLMNNLDITTYSYSGEKGTQTTDSIVLDTEVNYTTDKKYNNTLTLNGNYNEFNLNNILDSVTELVGLSSFKIVSSSSLGNNALVTINGATRSLNTNISLNSDYSPIIKATKYSDLSPSLTYKLLVPKGVKGQVEYNIIVTDRLGFTYPIIYELSIPNNILIIGKTLNSDTTVETSINANGKMKINSRTN